jgi:hypothetical protein
MTEPGPPARYFPVEAAPLRMRPRLQPFDTDFGNGEVDRHYFQRDRDEAAYRAAKSTPFRRGAPPPRERYGLTEGTPAEDRAHRAALDFIERTLTVERPALRTAVDLTDFAASYAPVSDAVQEDFVVVLRDPDGRDRAIAVYVCFPSGWRPEQILGMSFQEIHRPVPDFADDEAPARSMLAAMVERGPYVRFVWTLCSDDVLDHHPDEGPRLHFEPGGRDGWLRIERQVTVPFPDEQASLFLIRTYLRPFASLSGAERETLTRALRCMPESTARYKGLHEGIPLAIEALEALDPQGR